ncbi:hypothetical protein Dsin_028108 [Dipteronia sinensis]|uniref:RNase H type-1 domain-containing protein n=1 Tax=Dipteronia sinensis TaxID=43782 RepID=A0AAE0DV77_9ROSI|nr:hypothetical protein Dsin_028108 [Dipteronia sinensis]
MRARNRIHGLFDDKGIWWDSKPDMENIISAYFSSLFSSHNPSQQDLDSVLDTVQPKLSTRVLKWCYFRDCTFMEVKEKSSASFMWSSLIWGREILTKGVRWRVGDGKSIRVFKDKWIRKPSTFQVTSPSKLSVKATVNQLLTPSGVWDLNLFEHNFCEDNLTAILSIPTSSTNRSDYLIWHFNDSGLYSVKSGYWLARNMEQQPSTSAGLFSPSAAWWKTLWTLRLHLKIKIFMWRACINWIPTMSNLHHRKIQVVDRCPLCRRSGELTIDALWECKKLKCVSYSWLPNGVTLPGMYHSFFDFILALFPILKVDELELFCTILWRVWFLRNAGLRGEQQWEVSEVVDWATTFLCEYKGSCSVVSVGQRPNRGRPAKWCPPCPGFYKINCDAAIDSKTSRIGIGIVIRDANGFVMASSSQVFAAAFNAQIMEAMGILRAILFSIDCGMSPCVLESDAEVVVNWINKGSHFDSVCGGILSDISSLSVERGGLSFCFVPRQANEVAHCLAKNVLRSNHDLFWMEELPIFYVL